MERASVAHCLQKPSNSRGTQSVTASISRRGPKARDGSTNALVTTCLALLQTTLAHNRFIILRNHFDSAPNKNNADKETQRQSNLTVQDLPLHTCIKPLLNRAVSKAYCSLRPQFHQPCTPAPAFSIMQVAMVALSSWIHWVTVRPPRVATGLRHNLR